MVADILLFLSSFLVDAISSLGYAGIFLFMLLESAALPIPSEVIMPFSGFLVFSSRLAMVWVVWWGTLGNVLGSILLYWVGFYGGRPWLERYGRYFLISSHDLDIADRMFKKYGEHIIFFSRMLPVVRTYISFPAGVARMRFPSFCLYTFLGSLPWTFALAYLGVVLGENWVTLEKYFRRFDILIAGVGVAVCIWWVRRHIRLTKTHV